MTESSDVPGVIIFPPALLLGTALLGLLLHWIHPIRIVPVVPGRIAGAAIVLGGFLLARSAREAMARAGTNIRPDRPTTAIVSDGPFRFTRNPLYIAGTLVALGIALFVGGAALLILLVPMVAVLHFGVVLREERYLERKFGEEYRAYRERVRRWL